MKRIIIAFSALALAVSSCGMLQNLNSDYLLEGGAKVAQAMTLSDADIRAYVSQYVAQSDAQNAVLPASNAYSKRLAKITAGLTQVGDVPLNFKVYQTKDVNAFACANGSVRVYTGLMDLMDDDELLGVIGHEIGHVALEHTKKDMQKALLRSAALSGLAATGETMAALTQSDLAALGEAMMSAKFSRKQEMEADDFSYAFLKAAGYNPACMRNSLVKLQSLESSASTMNGPVSQLFSSHPTTDKRIANIDKQLKADGYIE